MEAAHRLQTVPSTSIFKITMATAPTADLIPAVAEAKAVFTHKGQTVRPPRVVLALLQYPATLAPLARPYAAQNAEFPFAPLQ